MHYKRFGVLAVVAITSALIAVTGSPSSAQLPTRATTGGTNVQNITTDTDQVFYSIARDVPGFGGITVDRALRTLRVSLTSPTTEAAKQVQDRVTDILNIPLASSLEAKPVQVKYNFAELYGWHRAISPAVWGMPQTVTTDIDEARNSVRIGMSDVIQGQPLVAAAARRLGIPDDAISVVHQAPVRPDLQTLRRPMVGGVQLYWSSGVGWYCSLGFPARSGDLFGFVTNSHCSARQGVVDGTIYSQPLSPSSVGTERIDPPLFVGGACPTGYRCRYSDANFAQANQLGIVELGSIAKTAYNSTTWNGLDKFRIVNMFIPLYGDILEKVGRTTGRTRGMVQQTCVDTRAAGTDS